MKLDGMEPAKNAMDKAFRFVGNPWPEAFTKLNWDVRNYLLPHQFRGN